MMMDKDLKLTNYKNLFHCFHNNVGYCKFREECHYQHFHVICSERVCRKSQCKARHPRLCRKGNTCKFLKKNICAFRHNNLKEDTSDEQNVSRKISIFEEEIRNLKHEIFELKNCIEKKQSELEATSERQDTKEIIIGGLKSYIKELEEENKKLKRNTLKVMGKKCDVCDFTCSIDSELECHFTTHHEIICDECEFKAKSKSGLKTHKGAKHRSVKLKENASSLDRAQTQETIGVTIEENNSGSINAELVKKYSCDKCKLTFADKESLNCHKKTMHRVLLKF